MDHENHPGLGCRFGLALWGQNPSGQHSGGGLQRGGFGASGRQGSRVLTLSQPATSDFMLLAMVGLLSALSSIPGADLGLFKELNRELGFLCQAPPEQAIKVCRLHARLLNH